MGLLPASRTIKKLWVGQEEGSVDEGNRGHPDEALGPRPREKDIGKLSRFLEEPSLDDA